MNTELLNKIKDEVAKEHENGLWCDVETIEQELDLWPEVCDRYSKAYAKECIKASLEKASKNAVTFLPVHSHLHGTKNVDKDSITSEENIVLL